MCSSLFLGLFAGIVVYAHVTDNMGLPDTTAIPVALLAGILVCAGFWLYSMEYDQRTSELEHWERKRR